MKNRILGSLFLTLGIVLNTWSIWTLAQSHSESKTQTAVSNTANSVHAHETPQLPKTNDTTFSPPIEMAPVAENPPVSAMPQQLDEPPETQDVPNNMLLDVTPPSEAPVSETPGMAMQPTFAKGASSTVVLLFDHRSQSISTELTAQLVQLARDNPDARFRMQVSAGEMKSTQENEKLAKRRARAVRKVLEDAGVPTRKVSYTLVVPGPNDGELPKTSEEWRRTTVRVVRKP